MGDEVAEGGGCGVNELEAVVVAKPDETAFLVHVVGCGPTPESFSHQSCCLDF